MINYTIKYHKVHISETLSQRNKHQLLQPLVLPYTVLFCSRNTKTVWLFCANKAGCCMMQTLSSTCRDLNTMWSMSTTCGPTSTTRSIWTKLMPVIAMPLSTMCTRWLASIMYTTVTYVLITIPCLILYGKRTCSQMCKWFELTLEFLFYSLNSVTLQIYKGKTDFFPILVARSLPTQVSWMVLIVILFI